jgi:protein-arginine kinase activator protein McsA
MCYLPLRTAQASEYAGPWHLAEAIVKCDNCDRLSVVHITQIKDQRKREHHLCSECAEKAGLAIDKDAMRADVKRLALKWFAKTSGRQPTKVEQQKLFDAMRREKPELWGE